MSAMNASHITWVCNHDSLSKKLWGNLDTKSSHIPSKGGLWLFRTQNVWGFAMIAHISQWPQWWNSQWSSSFISLLFECLRWVHPILLGFAITSKLTKSRTNYHPKCGKKSFSFTMIIMYDRFHISQCLHSLPMITMIKFTMVIIIHNLFGEFCLPKCTVRERWPEKKVVARLHY